MSFLEADTSRHVTFVVNLIDAIALRLACIALYLQTAETLALAEPGARNCSRSPAFGG
jgi:hypothetical protein